MSVLYRFNGQAAYEVDTGRLKKIRVVFGMIDDDRNRWPGTYFPRAARRNQKRNLPMIQCLWSNLGNVAWAVVISLTLSTKKLV